MSIKMVNPIYKSVAKAWLFFPMAFLLLTSTCSFADEVDVQGGDAEAGSAESVEDSAAVDRGDSGNPAVPVRFSSSLLMLDTLTIRTNDIRGFNDTFIRKLPFRDMTKVISLLSAVDERRSKLYFNGGLPDENTFVMDGANVTDIYSGGPGVVIPQDAIQEVEVQNGGFPAEYGGTNTGLVRTSLKTGGRDLRASLQLETDNYTAQGKESLGGYSYGYSDYSATLGGPVISNKVLFFAAAENQFYRDPGALYGANPNPVFWNGIELGRLVPSPQYTTASPDTMVADTLDLNYRAGNKIGGLYNRYSYAGTLLLDLGKIKLRASGAYSNIFSREPAGIAEMFDTERLPVNRYRNGFGNITLSQVLMPDVSYQLNVNYFANNSETGFDPSLGSDFQTYGSPASDPVIGKDSYTLTNYPWDIFGPGWGRGISIHQPGALLATDPAINSETAVGGRVDFTVAAGIHNLKWGGEYRYFTIRHFEPIDAQSLYRIMNDSTSTNEDKADELRRYGTNNFGYDELGNRINSDKTVGGNITVFGPRHPVAGSIYIQGEFGGSNVNLNAGLRYDYANPDSWGVKDPSKLGIDFHLNAIPASSLRPTPVLTHLSPRLGVSFTPGEFTRVRATYADFIQEAEYDYSYAGVGVMVGMPFSGLLSRPMHGFGLTPEKCTQYEIGFSQWIGEYTLLDVTAFYRNVTGMVQGVYIISAPGEYGGNYFVLGSGGSSTRKGVEACATLYPVNRLQAQMDLTLSSADYGQIGRGVFLFDYRFAKGDGGPILERSGIVLAALFGTGFTYATLGLSPVVYTNYLEHPVLLPISSTAPSTFEVDARIEKAVSFGIVDAVFYINVLNLLNSKNVDNLFAASNDAADDGWLSSDPGKSMLSGQADPALYRRAYTAAYLGNNSGNYESPRQIRFGVRFEY